MLGKIHPARHVMGWRNALDLFLSAKRTFGIFQTKAEKQVTENGPFGFTAEPHQFVTLCELARYSFYGGRLLALLGGSCVRAIGFNKFSFAPPEAEAEHVKHSREDRREV